MTMSSFFTLFKFESLDKSDETISTWTESYEPYEYEPEYDQSSLTTDQITPTTLGTTKISKASIAITSTTIPSETLTVPMETSTSQQTTAPTVATSKSIQSPTETTKRDISFETNSNPPNDIELDCDDDGSENVIATEPPLKSDFQSQSINSVNSLRSFQSQIAHQQSISSSSSGKTHLKYSMTGGRSDNSRTTRIIIEGQGNSGIQNVINCFGTYRNTSCIRQLCKVLIFFQFCRISLNYL